MFYIAFFELIKLKLSVYFKRTILLSKAFSSSFLESDLAFLSFFLTTWNKQQWA